MTTDLAKNEKIAESMKGNHNAAKGKLFYNQLRKVLVQEDQLKLRQIAEKLVEAAQEGEAWAVKEIMDRVDGKQSKALHLRMQKVIAYCKLLKSGL